MMGNPIQIVMTPVRNEAWILRAFLSATSLWADYILIADQMSTDGSLEICKQFPKVIIIDNRNPNFNEAERQAMLVKKAREVADGRDTLLWGLDADEILPANWQDTGDGRYIINSAPGDVFWFQWANLSPDRQHFGVSSFRPWLFHDDGIEPHGNYVKNMHSMRIPYPIEEKQMYYVKDFRVLHCGFLDSNRIAAKNRFYSFVDWEINRRSSAVLSEYYFAHRKENHFFPFPYVFDQEDINFPFDFWSMVEMNSTHTWFDDYIFERLNNYPIKDIRKLDIWDKEFISYYELSDPRRLLDKVIHVYFHHVNKNKEHKLIHRVLYKIIKMLY